MTNRDERLKMFGNRIRELREEKGLTQTEFAIRCSLDRTYISGIERGRRNVSIENIFAIADALEVELYKIFKFENEKRE